RAARRVQPVRNGHPQPRARDRGPRGSRAAGRGDRASDRGRGCTPLRRDARADPAARAADARYARARRGARESRPRLATALPDGRALGALSPQRRPRQQRRADDLPNRAGGADQRAAARAPVVRRDRRAWRRRAHRRDGRRRRRRAAWRLLAPGALRAPRARRASRNVERTFRGKQSSSARRAALGRDPARRGGGNGMIRVLLADDHAVVRTGFRMLLEADGDICVVGEADSGEAACRQYVELEPDVLILDIAMPGMGGREGRKRIRAGDPRARVLALSAHDDPMHARRALREGALGFLSKRSAPETLKEALTTVAAAKRYIDAAVAQKLALEELDGSAKSPVERLSEREFEVFLRLARGATVQRIADELKLSASAVGTHL